MNVRMLTVEDVDVFVTHIAASNAESGRDGLPHAHPYGQSEPYDQDAAREREWRRWSTPLTQPGWRRAWGLWIDDDTLIGHLQLAGGTIASELHRVELGMGVRRVHHRRGGGRMLLEEAVAWARGQASIAWIDLGVFDENHPARALYDAFGFVARGRVPDRYRVDGHRIDETAMSLDVGS